VRHVVKSGENFWTISRLYYGSGRFYKALWAANRDKVSAPDQLVVGTAILVPAPESLDRSLVEPAGTPRTDPDAKPPAVASRTNRRGKSASNSSTEIELALPVASATSNAPPRTPRTPDGDPIARVETTYPRYTVRPHDTLRSIARDTLGDSRRADEILEMNKDSIPDSKRLTAGQSLYLPDDARLARARQ
jgi:nucleoid-associated protein YgaU